MFVWVWGFLVVFSVCFAMYLDSGQFTPLSPEQTRLPQVFCFRFLSVKAFVFLKFLLRAVDNLYCLLPFEIASVDG